MGIGTLITSTTPDPLSGALSPAPTPVRKNPTSLERVAQDMRGMAQLLNFLTMKCPFLSLPVPTAVGPVRAFITDSIVPIAGNRDIPAQGGGTFTIPVYSDGQVWYNG